MYRFGLTFVLAVALAAPAQAASPVKLGLGEAPGVAVDAAGTAHVAYNAEYSTGQPLMYCAWPRGARGCVPRAIVADGQSPLAQPPLVQAGPAPGELSIVSARAPIQAFRSLDGGATFAPPAVLGTGSFFDGAFGPEGRLALAIRNLGYINFSQRSLAGPSDAGAVAELNRGYGVDAEVGFDGVRPVLVSGGSDPGIGVSSWNGTGDVHDPLMWSGPFKVAKSSDFGLASGPRGLWLAYAAAGSNRIIARKFTGQRFGRAHRVPAGRLGLPTVIGLAFAQDPTGRMVAVWYHSVRERLEYSASRTGSRWTAPRVLATGLELPGHMQVALGPDGRGLVVWDENTGDDLQAVRISVRKLLR